MFVPMPPSDPVANSEIRLTTHEALVLFELLSRWTANAGSSRPSRDMFESVAEPIALSRLLGYLETQLSEPFSGKYADLLDRAREALIETGGDDFELRRWRHESA